MSEYTPPRIQLDYFLRGNENDWSMEFLYAAKEFIEAHSGEEAAAFEVTFYGENMAIKIGRNVLERISLAEIDGLVEPMTEEIIAGRQGDARNVFVKSFIGRQLSGDLPDPE